MFHIDALPFKPNPLQLQTCALLVRRCTSQLYLSAGAYYSMPR
jgi:hypothetical protein